MANGEQRSIPPTRQQQIKRWLVGVYRRNVRDAYQDVVARRVALVRRAMGMSYTLHFNDAMPLTLQYNEEKLQPVRVEVMKKWFGASDELLAAIEADFATQVMVHIDDEYVGGANTPIHDILTLYMLTRLAQPERCIETGVFKGVSSLTLLQAFEENGHGVLHSIDIYPSGELVPDALRSRWHLYIQEGDPVLPDLLAEHAPVDFFFHDSDHTRDHMLWEYEQAWPYLRAGGILGSHDVVHTSAFDEFYTQHQAEIDGRYFVGNIGFVVKRG